MVWVLGIVPLRETANTTGEMKELTDIAIIITAAAVLICGVIIYALVNLEEQ